jgi:hypothetical protein
MENALGFAFWLINLGIWLFGEKFCLYLYREDSMNGLKSSKVYMLSFLYKAIDGILEASVVWTSKDAVRMGLVEIYLILVFRVFRTIPFIK